MDGNMNSNGIKYDPVTGEPVVEEIPQQVVEQQAGYKFDPTTGQPINQQPVQQAGYKFDPTTGQPINHQVQQQVQPQMQQVQPQQYVQPQMYQQPKYVAPQVQPKHPDETDPNAKKLLLYSIICFFAGHILPSVGAKISYVNDYAESSISMALSGFGVMVYLASLILMIILRVKYPKNKGGKILMIIMIVEIVLTIIMIVIIFASCYYILSSCSGMG